MTGCHDNTSGLLAVSGRSPLRLLTGFFLCMLFVTACTPGVGPKSESFEAAQWQYVAATTDDEGQALDPFVLVNVDRKIVEALEDTEDKSYFSGTFIDRGPPLESVLGVGDVLRITIFESGAGGLFVPASGVSTGGNYVTLPDQEVDQTGHISIPYAGEGGESGLIKVQGRRLVEVQSDIQQRLLNKAIEPQVIVTVMKRSSNLFSVIGDVNAPGRFSLDQAGMRLLDALSAAGGPKSADYSTLITLQRGTSSATARLSAVLAKSENNIFLQPNDLLAVKKEDRFYNVLGATKSNNRVAFESENVTVADAIAKSGGLDGDNAEPATVVVLRREDPDALNRMGIALEGHKGTGVVSTVYRLDFTQPTGLFLAQRMQLRSNDVVYVSTHPFSDASKLLGVLRDLLLIKVITN